MNGKKDGWQICYQPGTYQGISSSKSNDLIHQHLAELFCILTSVPLVKGGNGRCPNEDLKILTHTASHGDNYSKIVQV
jgi:hypothetical protein